MLFMNSSAGCGPPGPGKKSSNATEPGSFSAVIIGFACGCLPI